MCSCLCLCLSAGDPAWCVASSFMVYVLFMGQAAGVMLVSKATLIIVRSRNNDDQILGCKRPWRFVAGALLLGTVLGGWLLVRSELGAAAELLCVTRGHRHAASLHWAATTSVTTVMTVTGEGAATHHSSQGRGRGELMGLPVCMCVLQHLPSCSTAGLESGI